MKGCIFDLDGTLTDTLESLTYSVNLTLQEIGLPLISRDQCRRFVGDGARKLLERTLKACGDAHLVRLEEAVQVYGRIFHDNCTYHVTPYDGIPEMLRELKEKGIRLAVLSNKPHAQAVDVVREIFGDGVFDLVQGQTEKLPRKPDPAGVLYLLDKMEIRKEDCLYVGGLRGGCGHSQGGRCRGGGGDLGVPEPGDASCGRGPDAYRYPVAACGVSGPELERREEREDV